MPLELAPYVEAIRKYAEECRLLMTWVDLLDIAFIGALLSIALVWLRGRTARAILFALVPLLTTFAAAKSLKMFLTSVIFQFGMMALLVSIVVIFQDDFRRAFEGLAAWRPWRRTRADNGPKMVGLLSEALKALSESKTGALIVLQGRQSLDLYLRAGIPLHGSISTPILLSIFDANSPGHDGGVIIAEGRITSFGVHLPLSRNAADTGRLGTRHAAGLGLAEKSDALVLIVSEETGAISLARDGKISVTKSQKEIRETITDQIQRIGANSIARSVWEIPWLRLTGSYAVAIAMWCVFARPVNPVLRTVEAGIVYRGLPDGWKANPPDPSKVKITLFGPQAPLMSIDPTTVAITVDLARTSEGQQRFVLGEPDVSLPVHVRVQRIEPSEIHVQAFKVADAEVPVEPTWFEAGGRAPSSAEIKLDPPLVKVKYPVAGVAPRSLRTEPIDMRELRRLGRLKVKLRVPDESPGADLGQSEVEVSFLAPTETPKPRR